MKQSFFITGTDTGIGKTYVACKLIKQYIAQGYKVVGMKPVAAGCDLIDGQWMNEDVKLLSEASNVEAPIELVNPYALRSAIAPHIAAEQEGVVIDFGVIADAYSKLQAVADIVIVEGAGGLLVPLNQEKTILDLIKYLDIPAILVVGMRLGCLNHALLTNEVLKHDNVAIHGWVANILDTKMPVLQQNIDEIRGQLADVNQLFVD